MQKQKARLANPSRKCFVLFHYNELEINMITLISKLFIKKRKDFSNPDVRSAYGVLCGFVGIFLNIVLFAIKLIAGSLSGSVAIMADACNNLSDAGSSLVTLLGFKLASQKPDKDHPFGHGRFEYISGLVVSFLIIHMGFDLAKDSFSKILNPGEIQVGFVSVAILVASVVIKLYMFLYNRIIGKKIDSSAMRATAADSVSDCIATSVIIISMLIAHFTNFNIDGWCGLAVSLFIVYAGFNAAKETINPLLGTPPSKDFVEGIESVVMSYPQVLGIHDLIVHDYGPGRIMISLHAEVSEKADLLQTHDIIDNIEKHLSEKLQCSAVIHMDPIANEDEDTINLKKDISEFITSTFGENVTIHDFRMVKGPSHTNVIFDVVVPFDSNLSDNDVREEINRHLDTYKTRHFAVITIDRSYV